MPYVIGTDGLAPLMDTSDTWRLWNMNDIYLGHAGGRKYVPKAGDSVLDTTTMVFYEVTVVDDLTLIPTLVMRKITDDNGQFTESEKLLGYQLNTTSNTYCLYVDTTVSTKRLVRVDSRLKLFGTESTHVKVFKGTDISDTGVILSRIYDNNDVVSSVAVPLITDSGIKTIGDFYITVPLIEGEVVTVVVYSNSGHVTSIRQLYVVNTALIKDINQPHRFIESISLRSPYNNFLKPNEIVYPLNLPISALNLLGVVTYSDGRMAEYPVDGDRFALLGINDFNPSIVGQVKSLVLRYKLSSGEQPLVNQSQDPLFMTKAINLIVSEPDVVNAVKLYCYPVYLGEGMGYDLKWYLFRLDRKAYYEATPFVRFSVSTGTYDPTRLGVTQTKQVSLMLSDVSSEFKQQSHVQTVSISLMSKPQETTVPWNIKNDIGSQYFEYGSSYINLTAPNVIKLNDGITNRQDWLNTYYLRTNPIVNDRVSEQPPTPTHLLVTVGNETKEVAVSDFDKEITFAAATTRYSVATVVFIRRLQEQDTFISMSASVIQ